MAYNPRDHRNPAPESFRAPPPYRRDDRPYTPEDASHAHPRPYHRRYTPPPPAERHSPPQDTSRSPPRGPGRADGRREWGGRRDRDGPRDPREYHGRARVRSPWRDDRAATYRDRDRDRDRDREEYGSPRYDDERSRSDSRSRTRSRSRSPVRRRSRSPPPSRYAGVPSQEIILEGLPVEMTDEDIRKELESFHNVGKLDDVRVIRDRKTGVSRQFGFVKFSDVETATGFVDRNFPSVYLYGNNSSDGDDQGTKVRVAFSRQRDDRERPREDAEWKCGKCGLPNYPRRAECFRCQAPRSDATSTGQLTHSKPAQFTNVGDSDSSPDSTPSQYLLVRGLEPGVTGEILAKAISKLYKNNDKEISSAKASIKQSGAKVVSTTAVPNLGAQEGSLRRVFVVRDRRSDESWRYGFAEFHTVEDAQAALAKFNSVDRFTISSKPVILSYIHAGVFVPVLNANESTERFCFGATANPSLRLAYWDQDAYARELMVSATKPAISAAPQPPSAIIGSSSVDKAGLIQPVKESELASKKRKAETAAAAASKKTVPQHLQFWRNRHAELHGGNPSSDGSGDATKETPSAPGAAPSDKDEAPPRSYADLSRMCCYLCARQFKTEAEVNKHERLSQLHKDNLKSDDAKAKALAKLAKAAGAAAAAAAGPAEEGSEYRDRAKERRAAYNQPKKPAPTSAKTSGAGTSAAEDSAEPEKPTTTTTTSKGAALLSKMGWNAGQGLGAQGTGATAPIATELYVQGVGLGALGGKVGDATEEASRNTKGSYDVFIERTRDRAKERFERMG